MDVVTVANPRLNGLSLPIKPGDHSLHGRGHLGFYTFSSTLMIAFPRPAFPLKWFDPSHMIDGPHGDWST